MWLAAQDCYSLSHLKEKNLSFHLAHCVVEFFDLVCYFVCQRVYYRIGLHLSGSVLTSVLTYALASTVASL